MDFLGIGAQKAGTSWLYEHLRRHPDLWLPPIKELHYFDRPRDPLRDRLTHPRLCYRTARRRLLRGAFDLSWIREPGDYAWHVRYLLVRRSDAWYRSLFAPGRGRLTGEITPRYALLSAEGVAHVARALPGVRLLYMIRNPVERAWSNIKMGPDRYGPPSSWEGGDLEARLERTGVLDGGRYETHLRRWERLVPPERILVGFFEQISQEPSRLLQEVYGFLGVDTTAERLTSGLAEQVNPGPPDRMPDALRRALSRIYADEIQSLHERFRNRYTAGWLGDVDG